MHVPQIASPLELLASSGSNPLLCSVGAVSMTRLDRGDSEARFLSVHTHHGLTSTWLT